MHPITRKDGAMGKPRSLPFGFAQGSAPAEPRQKQDTAQRNNEGFVEALAAMVNPIKTVTLIHRGEKQIAWHER